MAADMTSAASRATAAAGTSAGHLVMHTAEEAARLLKVKRSWLERQAAGRKIPFSMLGGSYRFSDRHIAEIVRMNEVVPAVERDNSSAARGPHRTSRSSSGEAATAVAPLRPRPRVRSRRT